MQEPLDKGTLSSKKNQVVSQQCELYLEHVWGFSKRLPTARILHEIMLLLSYSVNHEIEPQP